MTFQQTPSEEAVRPLTEDEEAVIRSLPSLIYALPRAIDADMTQEQRISATEYLALMHLSEAAERRLRMGDLSDACEMSLSGTTRVVHRLEKEGFIRRVRCSHDGRSWHAALTDTGFARLEEAWPANLAAVRRHFLDHLAGIDLVSLAAALRKVAT
ncbi:MULTISPECIES: MarR family winged helix-turn-helix transcriptional regulator [Streptomyces]|uniref:MarR family transcriptional regulator n=1 Tax=Streptomyces parvulus TaxID=146923 RepID=A0A191VAP6_9ACTN|nr:MULTISPECIES: MarR family transcriptional regulator [Streptomyces]ANJ11997.1 MarR family transcriptional regulator [Streptomyces parvulus]MZD54611.1 MarR family transcriptional regulator [Streptomyces sp. SID5606]GGS04547.1 transcriptional regulator [Streptomyces parvulus]